jgi:predicted adenylyl cyclase CyaB
MRKNLELKARYPSLKLAESVCVRLRARRQGILRQTDTYFNIHDGRLKLRQINGAHSELIYYRRKNGKGVRYSDFLVVPLKSVQPMSDVCKAIFGVKAIVRKRRLLFLYKNARIHIDSVQRLGTFVEFEVIVNRGKKQAERLMSLLISDFQIERKAMIGESYCDLLLRLPTRRAR